MITSQSQPRKIITTLIISFLILTCLPLSINAQTDWHYIDMCGGDSYGMAQKSIFLYTYQWQIKSKAELDKIWPTSWTDIPKATTSRYIFSPPSYKYDYRIQCVVTAHGFPGVPDIWEFTVYNEALPTAPTSVSVSGDNYCPANPPGTITLTASGGSGAYYEWHTSSTATTGWQNISIDPSAPSSTTTYYVRTASGNHCLPSSSVSDVAIVKTESTPPTQILFSDNNICPGTSITLSLDGGSLGTDALWSWKTTTPPSTIHTGIERSIITSPTSTTNYTVETVNGDCGNTTPVPLTINVNDLPVIADGVSADADEVCVDGSTILRQVGGSDGSSTTWRWYIGSCGGSPVFNGDLYNTGSLTETTTFFLRAEDDCDTTDCVSKTITVVPLSIDGQPEPKTVCVAGTTSVSVVATGVDLEYQWKKDGVDIPTGATAATYWITGATLGDAGSYTCVVSDAENNETSTAADVTVLEEPVIDTQPVSTLGCYGETVQLEVIATVTDAATYQWKKNGVDMAGEVASLLEFVDATPDMNDIYSCFIDDACGSLSTNNVTLTIANPPPEIELGEDTLVCLNYEVELTAGLGYNSFLWSTGETTQTITVLNQEDDYYVTGTDLNGCMGYSDTVHIAFTSPYEGAEICIVTVDTLTGKNMVVWEKTEDVGIASYNVWREGSTVNDSVLVENVAFDAISVAVDEESEPELKAHRYWITAIDTCGNESGRSNIHKTMLLTTGVGPDRINLSWLEYEVQGQPYLFVGYKIYRSPISSTFNIIDSISSGSPLYPDINPPDGTNYYRIAGLIDTPCNPDDSKKAGTGPYHHSLSNLDDNKLQGTGINLGNADMQFAIYPNPFEDYTTVRFYNPENSEYTLYIRDLSGKLLQTREHIKEQEIRINRGSLKPGYYFIEVIGEKMFRGKMIIQ